MKKSGNLVLDAEIDRYERGEIDLLVLLAKASELEKVEQAFELQSDMFATVKEFEGLDEPHRYIILYAMGHMGRVTVNQKPVFEGGLGEAEGRFEDEIADYYKEVHKINLRKYAGR